MMSQYGETSPGDPDSTGLVDGAAGSRDIEGNYQEAPVQRDYNANDVADEVRKQTAAPLSGKQSQCEELVASRYEDPAQGEEGEDGGQDLFDRQPSERQSNLQDELKDRAPSQRASTLIDGDEGQPLDGSALHPNYENRPSQGRRSEHNRQPSERQSNESNRQPSERQSEQPRQPSERQSAQSNRQPSERQSEQDRQPSERQSEQSRQPSERQSEQPRQPSERQSEQIRQPSERQSEQSRQPSERQSEQPRQASERQSEQSRQPSERQSEQPRHPSERQSEQSRQPSERQSEQPRQPSERQPEQSHQSSERQSEEIRQPSERQSEQRRQPSERQSEQSRQPSERQSEQPRQSSERQSEQPRQPSERQSEQCRQSSERQSEQIRQPSERQSEQIRQPTERQSEQNRQLSERQSEQPRQPSERQSEQIRQASERQSEQHRQPSERQAAQTYRHPSERQSEQPRQPSEQQAAHSYRQPSERQAAQSYRQPSERQSGLPRQRDVPEKSIRETSAPGQFYPTHHPIQRVSERRTEFQSERAEAREQQSIGGSYSASGFRGVAPAVGLFYGDSPLGNSRGGNRSSRGEAGGGSVGGEAQRTIAFGGARAEGGREASAELTPRTIEKNFPSPTKQAAVKSGTAAAAKRKSGTRLLQNQNNFTADKIHQTQQYVQQVYNRLFEDGEKLRERRQIYTEIGLMVEAEKLKKHCPFQPKILTQSSKGSEEVFSRLHQEACERKVRKKNALLNYAEASRPEFKPTLRAKQSNTVQPSAFSRLYSDAEKYRDAKKNLTDYQLAQCTFAPNLNPSKRTGPVFDEWVPIWQRTDALCSSQKESIDNTSPPGSSRGGPVPILGMTASYMDGETTTAGATPRSYKPTRSKSPNKSDDDKPKLKMSPKSQTPYTRGDNKRSIFKAGGLAASQRDMYKEEEKKRKAELAAKKKPRPKPEEVRLWSYEKKHEKIEKKSYMVRGDNPSPGGSPTASSREAAQQLYNTVGDSGKPKGPVLAFGGRLQEETHLENHATFQELSMSFLATRQSYLRKKQSSTVSAADVNKSLREGEAPGRHTANRRKTVDGVKVAADVSSKETQPRYDEEEDEGSKDRGSTRASSRPSKKSTPRAHSVRLPSKTQSREPSKRETSQREQSEREPSLRHSENRPQSTRQSGNRPQSTRQPGNRLQSRRQNGNGPSAKEPRSTRMDSTNEDLPECRDGGSVNYSAGKPTDYGSTTGRGSEGVRQRDNGASQGDGGASQRDGGASQRDGAAESLSERAPRESDLRATMQSGTRGKPQVATLAASPALPGARISGNLVGFSNRGGIGNNPPMNFFSARGF